MSSLADLTELVGFFSYSRRDDERSEGALSRLRDRISSELGLQLGRDFKLWQDTTAIPEGALWEGQINDAIAVSSFFIPIVTPSAVGSRHCRFEFEAFLKREAALGRNNLIFPILYVRVPALEREEAWRRDDVLKIIGERQYVHWDEVRLRRFDEPEVAERVRKYCRSIAEALHQPWVSPEQRRAEEVQARQQAEEEARQSVERQRLAREADERRRAEEAERRAREAQQRREAEEQERQRKAADAARRIEQARRRKEGDAARRVEPESPDEMKKAKRPLCLALAKSAGRQVHWGWIVATAACVLTIAYIGVNTAWRRGSSVGIAVPSASQSATGEPSRAEPKAKAEAEVEAKRRAEEEAKNWSEQEAKAKADAEAEAKRRAGEEAARRDLALSVTPGSGQSFPDRLADGQPCPMCPEMVVAPAGTFMMGSPANEPGRYFNEEQVRITIAQPFAVGKFAVTLINGMLASPTEAATDTGPPITAGDVATARSSV
jgi:hypothetical protein